MHRTLSHQRHITRRTVRRRWRRGYRWPNWRGWRRQQQRSWRRRSIKISIRWRRRSWIGGRRAKLRWAWLVGSGARRSRLGTGINRVRIRRRWINRSIRIRKSNGWRRGARITGAFVRFMAKKPESQGKTQNH